MGPATLPRLFSSRRRSLTHSSCLDKRMIKAIFTTSAGWMEKGTWGISSHARFPLRVTPKGVRSSSKSTTLAARISFQCFTKSSTFTMDSST